MPRVTAFDALVWALVASLLCVFGSPLWLALPAIVIAALAGIYATVDRWRS